MATEHDLNVRQPPLAVHISKRSNAVNSEAILDYGSLKSLLAAPCKRDNLSMTNRMFTKNAHKSCCLYKRVACVSGRRSQ